MKISNFKALFRIVLEQELLPSYELRHLNAKVEELTKLRADYESEFYGWVMHVKWASLADEGFSDDYNELTISAWKEFLKWTEARHEEEELDSFATEAISDPESWLKWVVQNPDLAEKHFPVSIDELRKRIKKSPSYKSALIIQNLPEMFPKQKREILQYFGKTKERKIQEVINLLNLVLYELEFDSEIEQEAVKSVKQELVEQLNYWKEELKPNSGPNQNQSRLTIMQIALVHFYEGKQITRENAVSIAKENGHNSGDALYNKFTHFSSNANRKGNDTQVKLTNKIKLIESVIELLPKNKRARAIDEVAMLKSILESEHL